MVINPVGHCLGTCNRERTRQQSATSATLLRHLIGPPRTCGAGSAVLHRASPGGCRLPQQHSAITQETKKEQAEPWGERTSRRVCVPGGQGPGCHPPAGGQHQGNRPHPAVLLCAGDKNPPPCSREGEPQQEPQQRGETSPPLLCRPPGSNPERSAQIISTPRHLARRRRPAYSNNPVISA